MPPRQLSHSHSERVRHVQKLNALYERHRPRELVEKVLLDEFPHEIAVTSSFGAESAVLLHMVASVDPATPVIFLDTDYHFTETLDYRDRLAEHLGLSNVISTRPDPEQLTVDDPDGLLHRRDPNSCCHLRKTLPMLRAIRAYGALLTGRKRFQSGTRAGLRVFEIQDSWIKVNPLAVMSRREIEQYLNAHGLLRHRLAARGYPSVGCRPCTVPVSPGQDERAGRWAGSDKTECGIHFTRSGRPARGPAPTGRSFETASSNGD